MPPSAANVRDRDAAIPRWRSVKAATATPPDPHCRPASTHADLGGTFYDPVDAARFPQHNHRNRDQRWAARAGLGGLTDAERVAHLGAFGSPMPARLPLRQKEAG